MTKFFATASNARRDARSKGHALDQIELIQDGARFGWKLIETTAPTIETPAPKEAPVPNTETVLPSAPADRPIGANVFLIALPTTATREEACKFARRFGSAVSVLVASQAEANTLFVSDLIDPRAAKPTKEPKAPKAPGSTTRAPKAAPDGKTLEVIKLCTREEGASPAELIALTGWTKAPWKWTLSNSQGTGLADRYGYDLALSRDGRAVRYILTPKAEAIAA